MPRSMDETAVVRALRVAFRWLPYMHRWRDSAFSPVSLDERHGPEELFAPKAVP